MITPWPETTSWLTADDVIRYTFVHNGCRCLAGWIDHDFGAPPLSETTPLRVFSAELLRRLQGATGQTETLITRINDDPSVPTSLLARCYNETCEKFGYVEFVEERRT